MRIIDRILEEDQTVHGEQRLTAKRIFDSLRDELGFEGRESIVRACVRDRRRHFREMLVPLAYPPGHDQADFGEAGVFIAGVE